MRTGLFTTVMALVILIIPVWNRLALAAPMPLSPTSLFFSSEKEIFRSPLGFSIHAADTKWLRVMPPKNNEYLNAIFRAPTDSSTVQAALTVRSDEVSAKTDLTTYAKKWLKDYPRLGFQVLTAKKVRIGEEIGFLIDMINSDSEMQLRQVLFQQANHVVTLTCRDDSKGFPDTLRTCNSIIRTFKW